MPADTRPAPPIPPDVDLRGLEYMPLFGGHLFGSDFHACATDAEWRAGLTLWWAAWNQVPAGSLPNDDIVLCRLAELGRNLREWRRVKSRALHGFSECSDGRLYHPFLCAQALVAWEKRVKDRRRKAKWRQGRDADGDGDRGLVSASRNAGRDGSGTADGTGRDGTGRDEEESGRTAEASPARARAGDPEPGNTPPAIDAAQPTPAGLACRAIKAAGVPDVNPGHPQLRALLDAGVTAQDLADTAAELVAKGRGRFRLLLATIEGRRRDAAAAGALPEVQRVPWDHSRSTIVSKALELGLEEWTEAKWAAGAMPDFLAYTAKVRRALEAQQAAA